MQPHFHLKRPVRLNDLNEPSVTGRGVIQIRMVLTRESPKRRTYGVTSGVHPKFEASQMINDGQVSSHVLAILCPTHPTQLSG